jgi:hypothetical protein
MDFTYFVTRFTEVSRFFHITKSLGIFSLHADIGVRPQCRRELQTTPFSPDSPDRLYLLNE